MKYILTLLFLLLAAPAFADCTDDNAKFKTAKEGLMQSISDYNNCISTDTGAGNCDPEFSNVTDDQDDFDDAVSALDQDDCEQEDK